MLNTYLFLAFSGLWVLFFVYAWSLSRRQARLQKELEELKSKQGVTVRVPRAGDQKRAP